MINSHLLAFAGVLLVYLTGATIVALAVVVLACTVLAAAITLRVIKGLISGTVRFTRRVRKRQSRQGGPVLPLSMEEALRRAAAGKTASLNEPPMSGQGNTVPLGPKPKSAGRTRTDAAQGIGLGAGR